jgi:hypothetical protein
MTSWPARDLSSQGAAIARTVLDKFLEALDSKVRPMQSRAAHLGSRYKTSCAVDTAFWFVGDPEVIRNGLEEKSVDLPEADSRGRMPLAPRLLGESNAQIQARPWRGS